MQILRVLFLELTFLFDDLGDFGTSNKTNKKFVKKG